MKKTICLLPGDGIGPEIVAQGVAVLEAVAKKFGHEFDFVPALIGGAAIDATGEPLPAVLKRACWASARPWACSPTCVPPCCCPNWPAPACCVPTSRPAVWTSSWCAS